MRTCLVGMVDTGKSTALAALWFSVTERSNLCNWYLSNSDRPKDAVVWTELRDLWLSGEPLNRTEHESSPSVLSLKLSKEGENEKLDIVVPDIAGEDFVNLYETGRFPKRHAKLINDSDHILMFIHVNEYGPPVKLKAPEKTKIVVEALEELKEWHPKEMYADSKNVAMLRGIRSLNTENIKHITIVLSAWDLIAEDITPEKLFKQRFPLLHQYIQTNFEINIYGLSAQGCDYENNSSTKDVEFDNIERISVVGDESHHDITRIFALES